MTRITKEINQALLAQELKDYADTNEISIVYTIHTSRSNPANSYCEWDDSLLTAGQNTAIEALITAHDHTQKSSAELIADIRANAKAQIQGIPGWFKWDEETALAWHNEHVGDVIDPVPDDLTGLSQLQLVGHIETLIAVNKSMNTELRAMARMMIALRNELHPDLQD